ncbi:MAG: MATE family efflux transporter [Bacillota bacterium]|nr:MATE family efflux transporter [Bacillota bacterium]
MVSMFAMSLYSIAEGIFIGQKLGEAAFAAVNIAFPVILINFSLSDLVGVGSSVPISIALGRAQDARANNVFSCSLLLILFSSLLMGALMFFAAEPLARFMGADEGLLDSSARYIRTYALCSPFTAIFFAMDNYLRISGYVKQSMYINIFCNLLTLSLLAFFLIGLEMDVVGSALAACIAIGLCSLAALLPFLRGKTLLRFVKPRFSLLMLKEILSCGSPVFLSNIAGRLTSIIMNVVLIRLGLEALGPGGGTTAVAAYGVLMYASDMCQPLIYGMSDSLSPAIGFNWGSGDYGRVYTLAKYNFRGSFLLGLAAAALMFFGAELLTALFVDAEDLSLQILTTRALRFFSVSYLLRWFSITAQSFLCAIERPMMATGLAVGVALLFPLLVLWFLWGLGLDGIWLNLFGSSLLAFLLGALFLGLVRRELRRKRSLRLLYPEG